MAASAELVGVTPGAVQVIQLSVADSFDFEPGQYTSVRHPSGAAIPFSIASSPHRLPELELHFQPIEGLDEARLMSALLRTEQSLLLEPAAGRVRVPEDDHPLVFICGGSGIAQAWCMLEWLHEMQDARVTKVLWCLDRIDQAYLAPRLEALAIDVDVLVDPTRDERNAGLRWLDQHADQLSDAHLILCGGPPFVWAVTDRLDAAGTTGRSRQSDVYEYAPRG